MSDGFSGDLRQVCDFVAGLSWSQIPEAVRQRAVDVLADDLAAMAAGAGEPELRHFMRRVCGRAGGGGHSLLIAPGLPAAALLDAASWNALAGNWCELDEGFRLAICHAGIYTLPALMAEAGARGATLGQVLLALTGAYELVTRCAMSFHSMPPVVHGHALWSATGAAAAVGLLRGYTGEQLLLAVTGAITMASMGPRSHLMSGVMVRNGWAAAGAVNGIMAADWADAGFGGSHRSMEEVVCGIARAEPRAGELTRELGERWSLLHGYQKQYSCCQHGHSAVEACLALQSAHDVDAARIRRIHLLTHPLALTLDTVHPDTTLGARFSLPHMVAAALHRRTGGPGAFASDTLKDTVIAGLREKVAMELAPHPMQPPHDRPAWLEVELEDGTVLSAECLSAMGSPDNPISRDQFRRKLRELGQDVLPGLAAVIEPGNWRRALGMPLNDCLRSAAADGGVIPG
ncbi:MmgE/PrpD family protein [Alcaligenaceae bacterium]|nr:MmgE/PrpD family protein [Alcaligenaceae bacterium]